MKTTEFASRAFTPTAAAPSFYNTPIVGHREYERHVAGMTGGHATLDGQFNRPVELRRINRHGFTIITNHFSHESLNYALAEPI